MFSIVAIIIAELIWGAAPPIFKLSLNSIPPFTLAFIRFFFAGLIFLPFALKKYKKLTGHQWYLILLGSLFGVVINVSAFFVGLQYAPSINVNIISAVGPLVLYIMSIVILHERAHPQVLRGMFISFIGVLIIFFAPFYKTIFKEDIFSISVVFGNILFVIAMLSNMLQLVINKKIIAQVDVIVIVCMQFLIGSVVYFPLMLGELRFWSFTQMNSGAWVGVLYGVLFSSAIAYYFFALALKNMSAQKLGVFDYMKPIITVAVAIPLLGEYPDAFFIVGGILIFIGIFISERHPHYHRMHKKLHGRR
ncbi:hypothetical protein COV58_03895 [Candidatus Roizmanbacteria bacterium CG11_big_fil_rev_8_21_14_0_20_36_8]|uniref:EamA domain-containing protein n=2 Tax=Candidatus Roizmaniibacteriota TaxID=1752723 RepID=A0A2M6ITH7_9BACT|nr:MAG: hypothetical protein COV58_03895 [Candidatus Roizmanbacteria bacterium CG11_big_fil_rev_8_21_14_0_20_36_8]PIZ66464.1 MAG: hypothetical protein COY14_00280 [Candidatus Roizmanbacteria bacterium CG_4_10_14_0_2_um_filter_36_9]